MLLANDCGLLEKLMKNTSFGQYRQLEIVQQSMDLKLNIRLSRGIDFIILLIYFSLTAILK